MALSEIPMLRESITYAARLIDAAKRFAEPRYYFHRRVNWSYRYGERFYVREAECFEEGPDAYLSGRAQHPPELADVYAQRLTLRQVVVVVMKVLAHWLFHLLGRSADRHLRTRGVQTYRKCYVDDIELVFDPAEASVIRAVYPFPITIRRQLRYLAYLRRERLDFKLAGNPYLAGDLLRFIIRRDVKSVMRLESRAHILHAAQVVRLGVRTVQLSDEFDIGSLDFTRRLARFPVRVINSAHGAGKYLPVHAYPEFHILTLKQQRYYHATRPCKYTLRRLNVRKAARPRDAKFASPYAAIGGVTLVFIGQTFAGLTDHVPRNETAVLTRLRKEFGEVEGVRLFYKPHPSSKWFAAPPGFIHLSDLEEVNGRPETLFASCFSTCQIDPTFKGRKVLIRSEFIHPEIAFDESEPIITLDELVSLVATLAAAPTATEVIQAQAVVAQGPVYRNSADAGALQEQQD